MEGDTLQIEICFHFQQQCGSSFCGYLLVVDVKNDAAGFVAKSQYVVFSVQLQVAAVKAVVLFDGVGFGITVYVGIGKDLLGAGDL